MSLGDTICTRLQALATRLRQCAPLKVTTLRRVGDQVVRTAAVVVPPSQASAPVLAPEDDVRITLDGYRWYDQALEALRHDIKALAERRARCAQQPGQPVRITQGDYAAAFHTCVRGPHVRAQQTRLLDQLWDWRLRHLGTTCTCQPSQICSNCALGRLLSALDTEDLTPRNWDV